MKLTCLVDNAVQPTSRLWGEHGLAYLVETPAGRLLFDTGQSGTVLLHNLELLGIDPATIDALAISHAHYDHTGGLPALLGRLRPGIPLFANTDLFRERFSQREGPPKSIGLPLSREMLAAQLTLKLSAAPQKILPGVWTTGEITEQREFQGGSQGLLARGGEGDGLIADTYRDDMALVLLAGDRLALLCGCCHAGLLNTLAHVARIFPQPVALIAGGLHLAGVAEGDLRCASARLAGMPALQRVYPSHCTGAAAFLALAQTLGAAVVRSGPAGTVIEL
ncbi:MAG: MBL fold metallo-hydrolase [Chloroflexi bacterium]|nr:MBL fold metallo-hydrolase [Chloroflexota bacterium]